MNSFLKMKAERRVLSIEFGFQFQILRKAILADFKITAFCTDNTRISNMILGGRVQKIFQSSWLWRVPEKFFRPFLGVFRLTPKMPKKCPFSAAGGYVIFFSNRPRTSIGGILQISGFSAIFIFQNSKNNHRSNSTQEL